MMISVNDFLKRYLASGLDSFGNLPATADLVTQFAAAHKGKRPAEGKSLGKWLVQQSILTRYQARVLLSESISQLRWGDFVVQQPAVMTPFASGFLAYDEQGARLTLLPLNDPAPNGDSPTRDEGFDPPPWEQISDPNLVGFSGLIKSSEGAVAVLALAEGTTADALPAANPLPPHTAAKIALQLFHALAALHSHGRVAGTITPERIWLGAKHQAKLIWEPIEISILAPPSQPLRYQSPETFHQEGLCDQQTDIYSLGCCIYQLRFGVPPFPEVTHYELAAAHQSRLPAELIAALRNPLDAELLLRVLAHCLSKNRNARFSDAASVVRALTIVEQVAQTDAAANSLAAAEPKVAEPKVVEPKVVEPKVAEPKVAEPKVAEPKVAESKVAESKFAESKVAESKVAESKVAESKVAESKVAEPKVAESKVAESKVAEPKVAEPKVAEPKVAEPKVAVAKVATKEAIEPTEKSRSRRTRRTPPGLRRPKKNRTAPYVLGGLGFVILVLVVLMIVKPGGGGGKQSAERVVRPPLPEPTLPSAGTSSTDATGNATPSTKGNNGTQLVEDANLLWAAPGTIANSNNGAGSPVSPELSLLPPGSSLVVTLRPQVWMNSSVYSALSPEFSEAMALLQKKTHIAWDRVDRLTIGIEGVGDGQVRATFAVRLEETMPLGELLKLWDVSESKTADGATIYSGDGNSDEAYFVGLSESAGKSANEVRHFSVGLVDAIQEVAAAEGAPLSLPRNLAGLWKGAGANPDFAMLSSPNFLFADGRSIIENYAGEWRNPLRSFLVPDTTGFMLRMDLQDEWYGELRLSPGGSTSPSALVKKLSDKVAMLPSDGENFVLSTTPHPSWRALALRYTAMLRALQSTTRVGVIDGNAVANFYLPDSAAPNLLLTSWLVSNTQLGTSAMAANSPTTVASSALTDMEQLLANKFAISFVQESLEMAGETIRDQFNASLPSGSTELEIVLMGGDLEIDGITQNQQIRDFTHRDESLSVVLDDLVRRANPNRTATELYQDVQQLVWVVAPAPDDPNKQVILITTRTQAVKKYKLPKQFQPPANP